MKNISICMVLAAVLFCATNAWAIKTQTVTVNATVPTVATGLTVGISKVTGTVWTAGQTSIGFGSLVYNSLTNIFLPDSYYAVDIGVTDNTTTAWTVTHTRASLLSGTNSLDSKVNVSFNKQTSSTVGTQLKYTSFGNSNSIAFTKATLLGGWLRIYYGIGTGDPAKPDASGVTPIGLDTPAGTYTGSVTITLAP